MAARHQQAKQDQSAGVDAYHQPIQNTQQSGGRTTLQHVRPFAARSPDQAVRALTALTFSLLYMLKSPPAGVASKSLVVVRVAKIIIITGTYKNFMLRPSTLVALRAAALSWAGLGVALAASSSTISIPPQLHPDLWPVGSHSLDRRDTDAMVDELLTHMTLEEKIGQMIQADIASITPAELRLYKLGSILAGGGAAPGNDVRSAPQAWLKMNDE